MINIDSVLQIQEEIRNKYNNNLVDSALNEFIAKIKEPLLTNEEDVRKSKIPSEPTRESLRIIANKIMGINHVAVQCDDIHANEFLHQIILDLDKFDKHTSIRLLIHIIHVQQLQLVNAKIRYDKNNPFKSMTNFEYIDSAVKEYPPTTEALY